METIMQQGPMLSETNMLSYVDYYKMTMSQHAYEQFPDQQVVFTLNNRTEVPLGRIVDTEVLQDRLDFIGQRGFSQVDLDNIASIRDPEGQRIYSDDYIEMLRDVELPSIEVGVDDTGDLAIQTQGDWAVVTFWETTVLSQVNEMYFEALMESDEQDVNELYEEGDKRLTDKIERINSYNEALPEGVQPLQFAEFGTRRRFSARWQQHVMERLVQEVDPQALLGTSNVDFADRYGVNPVGTFAHEMPMVYAAMADSSDSDIRSSQKRFLESWFDRYPFLGIALSDTFGSDAFFKDFAELEGMSKWNGLRHDSGDPYEFAEQTIAFYEANGVDPSEKMIVFSDGLNLDKIIDLHKAFAGRIRVSFGWGTNLTNDLGVDALSIVMKATETEVIDLRDNQKILDDFLRVIMAKTVKLSDNKNKFTGPSQQIKRIADIFEYDTDEAKEELTVY